MRFGERIRQLREDKGLSQRALAGQLDVHFTYLSKIETGDLDFSGVPSGRLICKLAESLGADKDELLILAGKVPESIRRRVFERPEAFLAFASFDDPAIDSALRAGRRKRS